MVIKDFIIEWWIQAVFGIILTGLTVAVKNIVRENKKRDQENKKEQEAIKMGIKTMLYYNICNVYSLHTHKRIEAIYGN